MSCGGGKIKLKRLLIGKLNVFVFLFFFPVSPFVKDDARAFFSAADGTYPKSVGSMSHIHLVNSP